RIHPARPGSSLFPHERRHLVEEHLAPALLAVEMHEVSGAGDDHDLDPGRPRELLLEQLAVLRPGPEIALAGEDERGRRDQASVPALPADGEIETVLEPPVG